MNYIVVIGKTGAGKSYLCNHLSKNQSFKESNRLASCTSEIATDEAFLDGDVVVDTPGTLDTRGHEADLKHQAEVVDYMMDKTIRVVVFVFTDRMDSLTQASLQSVVQSGIHVLLVRNKVLGDDSELDEVDGRPVIPIKANETNFEVIHSRIASFTPTRLPYLVHPVTLFKTPLTRETSHVAQMFKETRMIDELIPVSRQIYVPGSITIEDRRGIFRRRRFREELTSKLVTITEDKWVPVAHNVFVKYRVTMAERFDGCIGVYSMIHLGEEVSRLKE